MEIAGAFDTAIIGAGNIGLSVAYYLARRRGVTRVVVVDSGEPMALTSTQSGENYRNWWPHPVMTEFTDHAIDLLEVIARESGNRIHMTRRGYALATRRRAPDDLIADLHRGYGIAAAGGFASTKASRTATAQLSAATGRRRSMPSMC